VRQRRLLGQQPEQRFLDRQPQLVGEFGVDDPVGDQTEPGLEAVMSEQ
jgi:hypothetical protein